MVRRAPNPSSVVVCRELVHGVVSAVSCAETVGMNRSTAQMVSA